MRLLKRLAATLLTCLLMASAAAAALANYLSDRPSPQAKGMLASREPETSEMTETRGGLHLSQGSCYDIQHDNLIPSSTAARVEIPTGGAVVLLVAERPLEQAWVRASRNDALSSGVVVTREALPPERLATAAGAVVPRRIFVEARLEAGRLDYRATDDEGQVVFEGRASLDDSWSPAAGVGAGVDGVTLSNFLIDGFGPDGAARCTELRFGLWTLRWDDLDASTYAWFATLLLLTAVWSASRVARFLGEPAQEARARSRLRAFGSWMAVAGAFVLSAAVPLPLVLPLAVAVLTSCSGPRVVERMTDAVIGRKGLVVGWLLLVVAATAQGWRFLEPVAPAPSPPTLLDPIEGWSTKALATVWKLPTSGPLHVVLDVALGPNQALLFRWSTEHPDSRTLIFGPERKARPGILLRRVSPGVEITPIGDGRALREPVRLPLESEQTELSLDIRQRDEEVEVRFGTTPVATWTSLPPENVYARAIPLTPLDREPQLTIVSDRSSGSPWTAATRIFAPRVGLLLLIVNGLAWLERRRGARDPRVLEKSLSIATTPIALVLGAAWYSTGRGGSDEAGFAVWVAGLGWLGAGSWATLRWAMAGRPAVRRLAVAALIVTVGLPATLGMVGPNAGVLAFDETRQLPRELAWAFNRTYEWGGNYGSDLRFRNRAFAPGWLASMNRVVAVGGSQTFGISNVVGEGEYLADWPTRVAARLVGVEAINLAICGKTSGDMVELAKGTFELLRARTYVAVFGLNDSAFGGPRAFEDRAEADCRSSAWLSFLTAHVPSPVPTARHLAQAVASLLPSPWLRHDDRRQTLRENVVSLDRFLRARGATLLLVYEPQMCDLIACEGSLRAYHYESAWGTPQEFLDWARANGIEAVNPVPRLRDWRDDFLFFDPIHLTSRGHLVMSTILLDSVRAQLATPGPGDP